MNNCLKTMTDITQKCFLIFVQFRLGNIHSSLSVFSDKVRILKNKSYFINDIGKRGSLEIGNLLVIYKTLKKIACK